MLYHKLMIFSTINAKYLIIQHEKVHIYTLKFNSLRPRQNKRHFTDDIFKCIFLNENVWIAIIISLKFVPKGPINNIQALVQIMDWRRPGDKPLSEPMMVSLPTHICITRPQWVNTIFWHCKEKFWLLLNKGVVWRVLTKFAMDISDKLISSLLNKGVLLLLLQIWNRNTY